MRFNGSEPYVNLKVALEFEGWSYINPEGKFERPSKFGYLQDLSEYMSNEYDVSEIEESFPYLILICRGDIPSVTKRPFTIAGLIGAWVAADEMMPEELDLGDRGESDDYLELNNSLAEALKSFQPPEVELLEKFGDTYYPRARAISYLLDRIVIEFDSMSEKEWDKTLADLPKAILGNDLRLRFNNGPLHGEELRRAITSMPGYNKIFTTLQITSRETNAGSSPGRY